MKRLLVLCLAAGTLAAPAGATAAPRLSKATVRSEAIQVGKEMRAHRSTTGVTGYHVAGCKRRSRRRVVCRLVLIAEAEGGPAACDLPVMGVLRRGKVRFYLGAGDCLS